MKKSSYVRDLIKSIEWMPGIEVIVYAALKIKRCSYFFHQEKLGKICKENNYDIQKFYSVIRRLNLEIKKDFCISISGWPNYDYFYKRYHIENSCRSDNVEGLFLDIPKCCAETFTKQGDVRDREILFKHPFRGVNTPEDLGAIYPTDEQERKEWWESFSQYFTDYSKEVFDYSEETKLKIKKLIVQKKLPEEIRLLFSSYIPCRIDCREFMAMAQKMNESLAFYLSPKRYSEIISGYKSGKLFL